MLEARVPLVHGLDAGAARRGRDGEHEERQIGAHGGAAAYSTDYVAGARSLAASAAPRVAATEIARLIELPILPLLRGEHEVAEVHATWRGVPVVSPHLDVGGAILYGASAYILYELLLRLADRLGVRLPAPRVETTPPWGDRYVGDGA